MFLDEVLKKNLENVGTDTNLFGSKIPKLSMKDRIGFLPTTIWEPNWAIVKELKTIVGDSGQSRDSAIYNSPSNALRGGGKGSFGKKASVFNPHLAQMILSAYCPKNAKIFDPFAGGGTRGFIATAMGHNYEGIDINGEEVDRILKQQESLGVHFRIEEGNAMEDTLSGDYDFIYTCPPYFNLEVYTDSEYDLSNSLDYETFLLGIGKCLQNCFSVIKQGSFMVWTVGNFRDKYGVMYHFSGDVVRLAILAGFDLWDEIIFKGASGNAMQRCGQFESNRKLVRLHENVIVLKKPNGTNKH